MQDPAKVLERQGVGARHPDMFRFVDNLAPKRSADLIRAYLGEAMHYAAIGKKPEKEDQAFELPAELVNALDADPDLAEAFGALTPGRQRSHVIALDRLKTAKSRERRIEALRSRIMSGKGATEY